MHGLMRDGICRERVNLDPLTFEPSLGLDATANAHFVAGQKLVEVLSLPVEYLYPRVLHRRTEYTLLNKSARYDSRIKPGLTVFPSSRFFTNGDLDERLPEALREPVFRPQI